MSQAAVNLACHEVQDALAAYALGALDPEELEAVERHLAECLTCRQQLTTYEAVAEALTTAVPPATPPPDLRERLLYEITATSAPPAEPIPVQPRRSNLIVIRRWVAVAAAAVFLAMLVGMGILAVLLAGARDDRSEAVSAERMLAAYLSAGGSVMRLNSLPASDYGDTQGRGSLVMAPGLKPLVVVSGCPPSSEDRTYRVWLATGGDRTGMGELLVREDGTGWMELEMLEPLTSYDALGITMVMASGARQDVLVGSIPDQLSA